MCNWIPGRGFTNTSECTPHASDPSTGIPSSYPLRATWREVEIYAKFLPEYSSPYCRDDIGEGFTVHLHRPDEMPDLSKLSYFDSMDSSRSSFRVSPSSKRVTRIKPHISLRLGELRKSPPNLRQCYFPGERRLKFYQHYTKPNCVAECIANKTLERFHCVEFSMPREWIAFGRFRSLANDWNWVFRWKWNVNL